MDNFDFDDELMSEEDEEELDSFIEAIKEQAEIEGNEGSRTSVANPQEMKKVMFVYNVMRYLTKGTSAKVTCEFNKPCNSMGGVSVIGKEITFTNSEWFINAVKFASNFDVYPKVDGTVQIDFTFHELTVPVE